MISDEALVLLVELYERRTRYQLYGNYYEGKHDLTFASEKFWNAFGPMFRAFSDNLCAPVVDACADRLNIVGFGSEDAKTDESKAAWDIWQANRMDQRATEVHTESLISGDAYVIVWPDELGEPRLYANCGQHVNVGFDTDSPGKITLAIKCWLELKPGVKKIRLNVYYPDRLEKYISRNNVDQGSLPTKNEQFEEVKDEKDAGAWPVLNEYGTVPVFHFANAARVGQLGKSELVNVHPLQNALNKSVADMLVGMEFQSFPQRYATGLEIPKDPQTGEPIRPFDPGADRLWASPSKDTQFGQFDSANLGQFIEVSESFRLEIARVSRTPIHYIMPMSGDFPSGESLKTAETPFVAKIKRKQVSFGNAWEDTMQFAVRIKQKTGTDNKVPLSAQWQDAAPRSDTEMLAAAETKSGLGVPTSQILRELGYSEEQIKQFKTEQDYPATVLETLRGELAAMKNDSVKV